MAAGDDGALEVLGGASGARGICVAAGDDGALDALGGASAARGICVAAGEDGALEVLGDASGARGVCVAAGEDGALEVLGGVSRPGGTCAAVETDGALEVLGGASGARGICEAAGEDGATEALGGASAARGAGAAAGTDGALGGREGTTGTRPDGPPGVDTSTFGQVSGSSPVGGFEAAPLPVAGESGCARAPEAGPAGALLDEDGLGSSPKRAVGWGARVAGIPGIVGAGTGAPVGAWAGRAPDPAGLPGLPEPLTRPGPVPACPGTRVGGRIGPGRPEVVAGGSEGSTLAVRGGGRPAPGAAGTFEAEGARGAAAGAVVGPDGVAGRGQAGVVVVGIGAGGRPGGDPAVPAVLPVEGGPGGAIERRSGSVTEPGAACGTGVSTGGRGSNAGPGRGMGVSIGMCGPGPEVPGGSSLNGTGVARAGVAGGVCRRSSGISRLRISGGGRAGSVPGSQAVQSPCGGNSAPHLRHLDTAA